MTEYSGMFDSKLNIAGQQDRIYSSNFFNKYLGIITNDGIVKDQGNALLTTQGAGLTVNVGTGAAIINGRFYENDSVMSKAVASNTTTYNRIDRCVVRMDASDSVRSITTVIKQGTPSASPTMPGLVRNATIYEVPLCNFVVAPNATAISSLVDERGTTNAPWAELTIPSKDAITLADIPKATTSTAGLTSLSSATRSTLFDRAATPLAVKTVHDMFGLIISDGVLQEKSQGLRPSTTSVLTIGIAAGAAIVNGSGYLNPNYKTMSVVANNSGNPRIDRCVIRASNVSGIVSFDLVIKQGTPATSPTMPTLTQTVETWELPICNFRVESGATKIDVLTDERGTSTSPWAKLSVATGGGTGGTVTLDSSVSSTSETTAATSLAVKTVNDKLVGTSITLAQQSSNTGTQGVVIGMRATSTAHRAISVGVSAKVGGDSGTALGNLAEANAKSSVALGHNAKANVEATGVLGVAEGSTGTNKWVVPGRLTTGASVMYEISHPSPDKNTTHDIRLSAVSSPTAGENIYKFFVEATANNATIGVDLPDFFHYLNPDPMIFVNGVNHFGRGYGTYNEDTQTLDITCETAGDYYVLVIATREDANATVTNWLTKGHEKLKTESWDV